MKKKIACMLMAVIATISMALPCMAAEYSTDGNSDCIVTAELSSTYTVSIPATLNLTDADSDHTYEGTYTVGAKGNIAADKYVEITPSASFDMTGATTNTIITAATTQETTKWVNKATPATGEIKIGTTSFANATGTVSVTINQADSYSGNLQFTYALK